MYLFISHSSTDTWVARRIADECARIGIETFLDQDNIAIGAEFERDILSALKRSDKLLALLTPWALERPYVWMEIGAAWFKEIEIIAILHGVTVTQIQSHPRAPVAIKERNMVQLNDIERYFDQLRTT